MFSFLLVPKTPKPNSSPHFPSLSPTPYLHSPHTLLSRAHCPSISDAHGDDPADAAAALLERGADPREPPRLHAYMLRRRLLRAPFHWNALVRSYVRRGSPRAALRAFALMSRAGAAPDSYSLPLALKAAALVPAPLGATRQLHAASIKRGLDRSEYCESGLVSAYAKRGDFDSALQMFDENPERKLGSWNAIVSALSQGGRVEEAIDMFIGLRRSGFAPDNVTMVSVASACGGVGDLTLAEQVHACALKCARAGGRLEPTLSNAVLGMYAKCGRTDLARRVFARIPRRDVSSWTAMISGLAAHGEACAALALFRAMAQRREGPLPNRATMVAALTACAHGGMVEEGMELLQKMEEGEIAVEPTVAHYGCVVDMLGRVGRLEEARGVAERRMPMPANAVVWGTLLGACEKHGDVAIGQWAAEKLLEAEPWNDGVYVVLSNIYAGAGMWGEAERARRLMRERKVAKTPGYSSAVLFSSA
ncbi:pentatricopeptide repeat-containing protein At1g77170-like [Ananas comosus]|uniref:Pentatricopeptide repeat-containing protein n=1 Tax=Ananas comosus TaxID=4615 RepID=A0A199VNT6_ANACO|nr:pentatricopeptide repeat-containing protein At1g77170-like [Ananas comosus]OAY78683.1 Pentatricopeptide repeat-containing protein [Ananas comosus]